MDQKRLGTGLTFIFFAVCFVVPACSTYRTASRNHDLQRLFQAEGRRVPCDVVDDLVTRRTTTDRHYHQTRTWEVKCEFEVDGKTLRDDFTIDFDPRYSSSELMVTYLPKDPRRAVLGPLSFAFPTTDVSGTFFGLSGLLVCIGGIVIWTARPKRWADPGEG